MCHVFCPSASVCGRVCICVGRLRGPASALVSPQRLPPHRPRPFMGRIRAAALGRAALWLPGHTRRPSPSLSLSMGRAGMVHASTQPGCALFTPHAVAARAVLCPSFVASFCRPSRNLSIVPRFGASLHLLFAFLPFFQSRRWPSRMPSPSPSWRHPFRPSINAPKPAPKAAATPTAARETPLGPAKTPRWSKRSPLDLQVPCTVEAYYALCVLIAPSRHLVSMFSSRSPMWSAATAAPWRLRARLTP